MNYIDALMAYETNDLNPRQDVEFIAYLVRKGLHNSLQGHYHRVARDMMNIGLIDSKGNPTDKFNTNIALSSCKPLIIDNEKTKLVKITAYFELEDADKDFNYLNISIVPNEEPSLTAKDFPIPEINEDNIVNLVIKDITKIINNFKDNNEQ